MGYDAYEESTQDGEPVELYEFTCGLTTYRYTSRKSQIIYQSSIYEAAIIDRSAFDVGDDGARSSLKITCPRDFPVAELFRARPPDDVVLFTLRRVHAFDLENGVVVWMGRVLGVDWKGAKAELSCEPVTVAMKRPGLRRSYSRACPHDLYGAACGVDRTPHGWTFLLSGVTITSSGIRLHSDGLPYWSQPFFAGGYLEYTDAYNVVHRRQIVTNAGDYVTILNNIDGIGAGSSIIAYFGCDHTTQTCRWRFNNLDNYGGFTSIPGINPMAGTALY